MNSSSDVPVPTAAVSGQAGALEVSDVTVRFAGLTALERWHARWAWRKAHEETIAAWKRAGRKLPPGVEP